MFSSKKDGEKDKEKPKISRTSIKISLSLLGILGPMVLSYFVKELSAPVIIAGIYILMISVSIIDKSIDLPFFKKRIFNSLILIVPLVISVLAMWEVAIWCDNIDWRTLRDGGAIVYLILSILIWISIYFFYTMNDTKQIVKILKTEVDVSKAFAYATTCIPIKKAEREDCLCFCFVKNNTGDEPPWMFPGGHIESISEDELYNLNEGKEQNLKDFKFNPVKTVIDKTKKEAGIDEIELVSSFHSEDSDYSGDFLALDTPVFNSLIKLDKSARCFSARGHRIHFHFTYVGKYDVANSCEASLDIVEVEIPLNLTMEKRPINEIENILKEKINYYCKQNHDKKNEGCSFSEKPASKLFYRYIPILIYNTMIFFNENPKLLEKKTTRIGFYSDLDGGQSIPKGDH